MLKEEKKFNTLLKSLYISLALFLIPTIFYIIGLTPLHEFKDMFLTGSIIYLCMVGLWIVAKFDGFIFLRNAKSKFQNLLIPKELKKEKATNPGKNQVLAAWTGVWVSAALSAVLTIASIFVNLYT